MNRSSKRTAVLVGVVAVAMSLPILRPQVAVGRPLPAAFGAQILGDLLVADLTTAETTLSDVAVGRIEASVDSTADPGGRITVSDLGAPVSGWPVEPTTRTVVSPLGPATATTTFPKLDQSGVVVQPITAWVDSRWVGAGRCPAEQVGSIRIESPGASIGPVGGPALVSMGRARMESELWAEAVGPGQTNRKMTVFSGGQIENLAVLDGAISLDTSSSDVAVSALAEQTTSFSWGDAITVRNGAEAPVSVQTGQQRTFDVDRNGLVGQLVVANGAPVVERPAGGAIRATRSPVTLTIRLGPESDPVASAKVSLFSATVAAHEPVDGIDCPPIPPRISFPTNGSTTTNDRINIVGTSVTASVVELEIDGSVVTPRLHPDQAYNWRYLPPQLWSPGVHRVRARQYVGDLRSDWSSTIRFTVGGPPTVKLVASSASMVLGASLTLTATAQPGTLTGTVTFIDQPTSGPDAGRTLDLGTVPLQSAVATWTRPLPSFGRHSITARYNGNGQTAPVTSAPVTAEATGFVGELAITELRSSGPAGAKDSYLELVNTWRGSVVPLRGIRLVSASGQTVVLPDDAPDLPFGRSYLIGGPDFSLADIATPDFTADVGSDGWEIRAPDSAQTWINSVDWRNAKQLLKMSGTPSESWGLVRWFESGTPDPWNPFHLVSASGAAVGGLPAMRGAPSPTGLADPYFQPGQIRSTRLDYDNSRADPPNRTYTRGSPGRLIVRRTITNVSTETVTAARVRMTALSEANGPPSPRNPQPAKVAGLRWVDAFDGPTSRVWTRHRGTVTLQNLSPNAPNGRTGGGLNSTADLRLPAGGLAPGQSVDVSFSFAVDSGGTFWFGYAVDTITAP